MDQFTGIDTLTEQCDKLLNKSIGIYQNIFDHYNTLAQELSENASGRIPARLDKINILCSEVKTVDDYVSELIPSLGDLPESTGNLLAARDDLLTRLQEANLNIVNKANKTKSLLLHEIKGMHTGRNALQGYGNAVGNVKKNIVNGSF